MGATGGAASSTSSAHEATFASVVCSTGTAMGVGAGAAAAALEGPVGVGLSISEALRKEGSG